MIDYSFSKTILDKAYSDTLALLIRAEVFLKGYSQDKTRNRSSIGDLKINCEMTRVTARLTQVMAWMLAQKAALAGEMTFEEAYSDQYAIQADDFCLTDNLTSEKNFYPLPLQELLKESLALYSRAVNLSSKKLRISSDQTSQNAY
jgi:regulator of CtrA degradation